MGKYCRSNRPAPWNQVCLSDRNWIFCKKVPPAPHGEGCFTGDFVPSKSWTTQKTARTWNPAYMVNSLYKDRHLRWVVCRWSEFHCRELQASCCRHFLGSQVFHFGNTISPLHNPNPIRTALWCLSKGSSVPSVSVALNRSWCPLV